MIRQSIRLQKLRYNSYKDPITTIEGLVQNCSISVVFVEEIPKFSTKPSKYSTLLHNDIHVWQSYTDQTDYLDGLLQDCSNSIANVVELLQSCTKPSIWHEI